MKANLRQTKATHEIYYEKGEKHFTLDISSAAIVSTHCCDGIQSFLLAVMLMIRGRDQFEHCESFSACVSVFL